MDIEDDLAQVISYLKTDLDFFGADVLLRAFKHVFPDDFRDFILSAQTLTEEELEDIHASSSRCIATRMANSS